MITVLDKKLKGARSKKQAFPNWLGPGGSLVKELLKAELLGQESKPLNVFCSRQKPGSEIWVSSSVKME